MIKYFLNEKAYLLAELLSKVKRELFGEVYAAAGVSNAFSSRHLSPSLEQGCHELFATAGGY